MAARIPLPVKFVGVLLFRMEPAALTGIIVLIVSAAFTLMRIPATELLLRRYYGTHQRMGKKGWRMGNDPSVQEVRETFFKPNRRRWQSYEAYVNCHEASDLTAVSVRKDWGINKPYGWRRQFDIAVCLITGNHRIPAAPYRPTKQGIWKDSLLFSPETKKESFRDTALLYIRAYRLSIYCFMFS